MAGSPLMKASYRALSVGAVADAADFIDNVLEFNPEGYNHLRARSAGSVAGGSALHRQITIGNTLAGLQVSETGAPTAVFILLRAAFKATMAILQGQQCVCDN